MENLGRPDDFNYHDVPTPADDMFTGDIEDGLLLTNPGDEAGDSAASEAIRDAGSMDEPSPLTRITTPEAAAVVERTINAAGDIPGEYYGEELMEARVNVFAALPKTEGGYAVGAEAVAAVTALTPAGEESESAVTRDTRVAAMLAMNDKVQAGVHTLVYGVDPDGSKVYCGGTPEHDGLSVTMQRSDPNNAELYYADAFVDINGQGKVPLDSLVTTKLVDSQGMSDPVELVTVLGDVLVGEDAAEFLTDEVATQLDAYDEAKKAIQTHRDDSLQMHEKARTSIYRLVDAVAAASDLGARIDLGSRERQVHTVNVVVQELLATVNAGKHDFKTNARLVAAARDLWPTSAVRIGQFRFSTVDEFIINASTWRAHNSADNSPKILLAIALQQALGMPVEESYSRLQIF